MGGPRGREKRGDAQLRLDLEQLPALARGFAVLREKNPIPMSYIGNEYGAEAFGGGPSNERGLRQPAVGPCAVEKRLLGCG